MIHDVGGCQLYGAEARRQFGRQGVGVVKVPIAAVDP
jgi:hypothetical protein